MGLLKAFSRAVTRGKGWAGGATQYGGGGRIRLRGKWETNITFPSYGAARPHGSPGMPLPAGVPCVRPPRGAGDDDTHPHTVGGTGATPAPGLRARTRLSPLRHGTGLDAPRRPRGGFSRPGENRARPRAAERAPPVARRSGAGSARGVGAKRDENRPGASGGCGGAADGPVAGFGSVPGRGAAGAAPGGR